MKTRFIILMLGLSSLFVATAAVAHKPGHVVVYGGPLLSGGVTLWGNSHGQSGYAGNINLGFANTHARMPVYGHVHGPSCGHAMGHSYALGFKNGYRNGNGYIHWRGHGRKHRKKYHH